MTFMHFIFINKHQYIAQSHAASPPFYYCADALYVHADINFTTQMFIKIVISENPVYHMKYLVCTLCTRFVHGGGI